MSSIFAKDTDLEAKNESAKIANECFYNFCTEWNLEHFPSTKIEIGFKKRKLLFYIFLIKPLGSGVLNLTGYFDYP